MRQYGTLRLVIAAGIVYSVAAALPAQSSGATQPAENENVVFLHYHNGEAIGTTEIIFRAGQTEIDERTAIARDLEYRPLGTWTSARYSIGPDGRLQQFAIGSTAAGEYIERAGRIENPGTRPSLAYSRTTFRANARTTVLKRRLDLAKGRPTLLFDLNVLAPLIAFCKKKVWDETFDAMAQATTIRALVFSEDGRLDPLPGFWIRRTREKLPIEDRAVPCNVFSLKSTTGRSFLVSVSEHEGAVLKIEEPSRGYSIERTFETLDPPKPIGLAIEQAFDRMTRQLADSPLGLSLSDRDQLEEVVYRVDLPYRRSSALMRPWQTFDGDDTGGHLKGRVTVRSGVKPFAEEGALPKAEGGPVPVVDAAIKSYAARLRKQHTTSAALIDAVGKFCSEEIAFAFNVREAPLALRTGFGNVVAKAKLANELLGAAGIRTRTITGLVYTGSAFVPHRWLEAWNAESKHWIAIDPTLGSVSPLHLALGTPWVMRDTDHVSITVDRFKLRPVEAGKRGKVRWPDGEMRVYGLYHVEQKKLFGYVRSRARYREQEGVPAMRLETDLRLDYGLIKKSGFADLKALSWFDRLGAPISFSVSSWLDGKEHRFLVRKVASEATITETERPLKRVPLPPDTFLAAETFYNHWSVYFSSITPVPGERRVAFVLKPNKRQVVRWNLVHRGVEKITIRATGKAVSAHRYDAIERDLRFWVTGAGLMIAAEDRRFGIRVALDKKSIVQQLGATALPDLDAKRKPK